MTTAVVPCEVMRWQRQGDAVVQNALHVVVLGIALVGLLHGEETGRGHLFWVAYHDEGLTTGDGADGFARGHLRCLVEHHNIELLLIEVDELSNGEGAHQHTRTELGKQRGYLVDDMTYGGAATAGGDVTFQYTHLRIGRGLERLRGDV